MLGSNMNQPWAAGAEAAEYRYPAARLKRRQAPPRTRVQLEQVAHGDSLNRGPCYRITKRGRFWNVIDPLGALVCVTVYKRGAKEVIRRLDSQQLDSDAAPL